MNDRIFNIDYDKLIAWLVPRRIRKVRLHRYLRIVVSGVNFLYQDFRRFRKAKLYELMITPQVCYLERMLNDRYDFTQRRIVIVDSQDKPPFYIYQHAELKPKFISRTTENKPKFIYTAGESGLLQDDFVVLVPAAVSFNANEMRSLVKRYKLAGTRFKIQIV
ncbi:MAG: hypothetical protein EOP49_45735 [Sphingobacteriales bacterium]|nr:MAG: hypothetical protein EOP49_45735 [Sphingobacteriales bacterium]